MRNLRHRRWMRVVDLSGDDDRNDADKLDADILVDGVRGLGVQLPASAVAKLLTYTRLLQRWNRAFNLVSRQDVDRLISRHLLDSLSVLPWLRGPRVMDLGTGAGLPGIPLAVARADICFSLVDRSARKIRFLAQVVAELGLANVFAYCQNVQPGSSAPARTSPVTSVRTSPVASVRTSPVPLARTFAAVTIRAVAPAVKVWPLAVNYLETGGRLILLNRARRDDMDNDAEASFPGGLLLERAQVRIPGLDQPHEVMIVERC